MPQRISIIGLAKSGTSALYSAIKAKLPEPRRLMFEPTSPRELSYVSDDVNVNGLTKLMFGSAEKLGYRTENFTHNLAIVRDPRDTIVSSILFRFNRMKLLNNPEVSQRLMAHFVEKETDPRAKSVVDILDAIEKGEAQRFRSAFQNQLKRFSGYLKNSSHHKITFDQMISGDFSDLNSYLNLELEPPPPLQGWIEKIGRKGESGDWRHWFTSEDVEFFQASMSPFIDEFGFDGEWELAETPQISPEHCSGYIRRLSEARRVDPNLKNSQVSDTTALKSAAEDGKVTALVRLVELLTESASPSDLQEAAEYNYTLGAMGFPKHAVMAGRYFVGSQQTDRAISAFRLAVNAGGGGYAHLSLARQLLTLGSEDATKEALELLSKGAELGDEKCGLLYEKVANKKG